MLDGFSRQLPQHAAVKTKVEQEGATRARIRAICRSDSHGGPSGRAARAAPARAAASCAARPAGAPGRLPEFFCPAPGNARPGTGLRLRVAPACRLIRL